MTRWAGLGLVTLPFAAIAIVVLFFSGASVSEIGVAIAIFGAIGLGIYLAEK